MAMTNTRDREANTNPLPVTTHVALSSGDTSTEYMISPAQFTYLPPLFKSGEKYPCSDPNMADCDPIYSELKQPYGDPDELPYGIIHQSNGLQHENYDTTRSHPSTMLAPQNVGPQPDGVLPFRCPEYGCGAHFDQRGHLNRHSRKHTAKRPFICATCGDGFKLASVLGTHMRVHSNKFMFQCEHPQCTKQFKHKYSLQVHRRTHTGERPFQCEKCALKFRDRTALTVHTRRKHSHVYPYACTYCDSSFCESSSLRRHIATHSQARPHWCSICQFGLFSIWILTAYQDGEASEKYALHCSPNNKNRRNASILCNPNTNRDCCVQM
eukprot:1060127_1